MKRLIGVLVSALAVLVCASAVPAQDMLVPAGTLLNQTSHRQRRRWAIPCCVI